MPEGDDVELLGSAPSEAETLTATVDRGLGTPPWTAVLAALVVLVGLFSLTRSGDDADRDDGASPVPTSPPTAAVAGLTAAETAARLVAVDSNGSDVLLLSPEDRARFDLNVRVVVTDGRQEARLVDLGPASEVGSAVTLGAASADGAEASGAADPPGAEESDTRLSELPDLARTTFDPSGRWLAGIGVTAGTGRWVLWAGPVEGPLEPVAVDVRDYAWHDTEPGRLAWSGRGRRTIGHLDFTQPESMAERSLPFRGLLKGWGDWGYALQTSNVRFATTIVDRDLVVTAADVPGRFAGYLPEAGVVLSGGDGPPVAVEPTSGTTSEVEWLTDEAYVWRIDRDPSGGPAVALISPGGLRAEPFKGELRAIDGGRARLLAEVNAFTDVEVVGGGRWVVVADQSAGAAPTMAPPTDDDGPDTPTGSGLLLTIEVETGRRAAIAMPEIFGRQWLATLSVG